METRPQNYHLHCIEAESIGLLMGIKIMKKLGLKISRITLATFGGLYFPIASASPTTQNYYCSCVPSGNNPTPFLLPRSHSDSKILNSPQCVSNPTQHQCDNGEIKSCAPSDCKIGTPPPEIHVNQMGLVTYLLPVESNNCKFPQFTPYVFNNVEFDEPLEIGLGTNANEKCGLKFGLIGVSGFKRPSDKMRVEWKSKSGDPQLCEGQALYKIPITFVRQGTSTIDISKVSFTKPFFLSGGNNTGECLLTFSLEPEPLPGRPPNGQGRVGFTGPPTSCSGTTGKEPGNQFDSITLTDIMEGRPIELIFKHNSNSSSSCRLRLGI